MDSERLRQSSDHYLLPQYINKERLASYWHQVDEVTKLRPADVLCIGPGNFLVPDWLSQLGINVMNLELISSPLAHLRGDVSRLPFKDGSFDVVLCAQVLEHVPWERFGDSLREIRRVGVVGAVVTLPRSGRPFRMELDLGFTYPRRATFPLPQLRPPSMRTPDEHYWEIDQPGQSLKSVEEQVEAAGFVIDHSYRVWEFEYHHVFSLRMDSTAKPNGAGAAPCHPVCDA